MQDILRHFFFCHMHNISSLREYTRRYPPFIYYVGHKAFGRLGETIVNFVIFALFS